MVPHTTSQTASEPNSKKSHDIATDCIWEAREMEQSNLAEVSNLSNLENNGTIIGKAQPKPGN